MSPASVPSVEMLGPRFEAFARGLSRPVVFFDIEATGTDPLADRIIELCAVRVMPGGTIESPRTWRFDPEVRIPCEAIEVHGITNDALRGEPTFGSVAPEIAEVFAGCDLAGFAVGRFDTRILQAEFLRAGHAFDVSGLRVIDAQVIFHTREPRHLAAALRFYRDKELVDAHGARADTVASLEVFAGQLERYADLSIEVDQLHEVSVSRNEAYCDQSRRFAWRDNEPVFNFGRLRGKSLRWVAGDPTERKYLLWFLDGNFEDDAKTIVRAALEGKIVRRRNTETSVTETTP